VILVEISGFIKQSYCHENAGECQTQYWTDGSSPIRDLIERTYKASFPFVCNKRWDTGDVLPRNKETTKTVRVWRVSNYTRVMYRAPALPLCSDPNVVVCFKEFSKLKSFQITYNTEHSGTSFESKKNIGCWTNL
jgi:hypothetical protein